MKKFALLCALVVSSSAFARQYIQCNTNNTSEVAIVNLTTPQKGTFFVASGMEMPDDERFLADIVLAKVENGKHIYTILDDRGNGTLVLPSSEIYKKSDYLKVEMNLWSYRQVFSCFARMYPDSRRRY